MKQRIRNDLLSTQDDAKEMTSNLKNIERWITISIVENRGK